MGENEDILVIDFKALFSIVWKNKWWIILITSIFTVLGGIYAFTAREEFVSEGKLLPEISGGAGNSLGSLANLVGIGGFELGLKNNTDAIRPDLYPDILQATPFFMNLLKKEITTKSAQKEVFEKFYHRLIEENEKFEDKFLKTPKGKPDGVVVINRLTEDRIKDLKDRISASIDKKTGVISISVKMPDPVVAADVAKFAIDYMTNYITNYRTEKIRKEVDFLSDKVAASKGKYYATQERKAQYTDMFQAPTIRLQTADVQRERLESEYKISANVYNELLKKLEEARLKLHQETPVFQIAQAPVVPNLKSEPQKAIIIIIFSIFGGIIGAFFILIYKNNFRKIIKNI
ncbi:MAG: lipopolysaccharide biosynthesis protein [Cytophagaceae bacterium]|nr:lipopolysaccharide biosynthesis protein [Cytophagaceae bacterium]